MVQKGVAPAVTPINCSSRDPDRPCGAAGIINPESQPHSLPPSLAKRKRIPGSLRLRQDDSLLPCGSSASRSRNATPCKPEASEGWGSCHELGSPQEPDPARSQSLLGLGRGAWRPGGREAGCSGPSAHRAHDALQPLACLPCHPLPPGILPASPELCQLEGTARLCRLAEAMGVVGWGA